MSAPANTDQGVFGVRNGAMRGLGPAAIVIFLLAITPAAAEHATIDLRVYHYASGTGALKGQASAFVDEEPPAGGVNPRPLLKVKAGEPLVLQFILINTYPHGELKDAQVRFFVAREEKAWQKKLPDLSGEVAAQGMFTVNFKPKSRVGARVAFTLSKPGFYLARVETLNTHSDHEHFSAIEIQAE
jgi:hypothetical protein